MSDEDVTQEQTPEQEDVAEEEIENEEVVDEELPKKENCIVIPEHMKPLFECCKDFYEGKIDDSDFFARALVRTGEFMQNVKKKREGAESE